MPVPRRPRRTAQASAPRPTIHDVARRAGVSLGTVSNVLNGRDVVSKARKASVTQAIRTLGYVPDGVAQSLRRRRSRVVGLCVPVSSNAYFAALLEAFEEIAAAEGYELMQVLSRHDPALELRRIKALVSRRVDGLVVVPCADATPTFDLLARARLPAVMVDRASADTRFDYVTLDDYGAMAAATRALLGAGHRRILFLMRYPGLVTTRERIRAFRETLAAVPNAVSEELVRDTDDARFEAALLARLARGDRPTALVASNSDLALAILRILPRARLRCPDDVSLLAFDAAPWADVLTPPLAVVRQPTQLLARRAWQVLVERMHDRHGRPQRIMLSATLDLRASVAAPPPAVL